MLHLTVAYVLHLERERDIVGALRRRDVLRTPDSAREPIDGPARARSVARRGAMPARASGR